MSWTIYIKCCNNNNNNNNHSLNIQNQTKPFLLGANRTQNVFPTFKRTREKSCLWIKSTDTLNSSFICITTLHVLGSLSAHHQEFLAIHRHGYILCRFYDRLLPGVGWNCPSSGVLSRTLALVHFMQILWPFATRSRMELPIIRSS